VTTADTAFAASPPPPSPVALPNARCNATAAGAHRPRMSSYVDEAEHFDDTNPRGICTEAGTVPPRTRPLSGAAASTDLLHLYRGSPMPRPPQRRPGEQFGGWTLREPIEVGGNAEVWLAERGDDIGALKALKQRRRDDEPNRRFDRETRLQRQLTTEQFPGILPILDAFDPGDSSARRAWIVTPLATPMPKAIPQSTVAERVAAIQEIADTLARLHARGFTHRDIKPDNLFRYQDQWVVGDFGLVHANDEDQEPITEESAVLGPRFFMAPEMITGAAAADGAPADVYSLAKVLWVVLTGQNYPHPGPHQPHEPLMQLSTYLDHPRLGTLDLLIARATSLRPEHRPSAGEIAGELSMWRTELASLIPVQQGGLEAIRARLARSTRPGLELQVAQLDIEQEVQRTFDTLTAALEPIQRAYTITGGPPPVTERTRLIADVTAIHDWVLIGREQGEPTGMCVRITHSIPKTSSFLGGGERWVSLSSGFGMRREINGTIYLAISHVITRYDHSPKPIFEESKRAYPGSASLEHACRDLTNSLVAGIERALSTFLEQVEDL
jgi:serine/threonine protein kinase